MIVKNVKTDCAHCGLPVPTGLLKPGADEQFCCHGCSAAWQLIHSSGLDSFYRMVDSGSEQQSLRQREAGPAPFTAFDEAGFLERFAIPAADDHQKITLAIEGIHCAACIWLIEKLPTIVAGVREARVRWAQGTVTVVWQPAQVPLSRIATALFQLGYTPHPVRQNAVSVRRNRENRRQLVWIGIAAAAAGNNMLIAAALYLGMFSYMASGIETLLRWVSCGVGLVSFLGPGRAFLQGAFNALKTRTPHMDLPVAVGLTAAVTAGLVNTIRGTGEIYFDSLSVLICLLLVGRWVQFRQQNRAADAVELLYRLTPRRARRLLDGKVLEISADDLEPGHRIEICPGDLVPADGVIVEGRSQIDESLLTGESRPVPRAAADRLSAGTKNLSSRIVARVTATGRHTRISKIVELVEEASSGKPRIVQWANRIGGYFVVTVLLLAVVTFIVWMFLNSAVAVDHTVALLVVACPCALAMATPLAISVALGRLARRKILVKAGDVLQSLSRPGMIWLDKTGTLTEGKMRVVDWYGHPGWQPVVAEVESRFRHPVAAALTDLAGSGSQPERKPLVQGQESPAPPSRPTEVRDARVRPGGVTAIVHGKPVLIGNRALLQASGITLLPHWQRAESAVIRQHHSPCWIAVDGTVVALAGLGDALRPEARAAIASLKKSGWVTGVLSGDHPQIVRRVAGELGIRHVHAAATPADKVAVIRESLEVYPTTVMVGDGVNDSGALAAATVGIAVHQGAEASLAAAPVYLGRPGLQALESLLRDSKSTTRTIRINFAASLGYNILGASLAMLGWINPLAAAILMPISSLTVISLSLAAARR